MTENLTQLTLKHIRQESVGSLGVTDGELEAKVEELLDMYGLSEKAKRISEKNIDSVAAGLASLWRINSIGIKMEQDDAEIIGGAKLEHKASTPDLKKITENKINEIQHSHHGMYGWFKGAVTTLVELGAHQNPSDQKGMKDWVLRYPSNYVHSLDMASQTYTENSTQISWAENAGYVNNYLDSVRSSKIKLMKAEINGILAPEVANIKTP